MYICNSIVNQGHRSNAWVSLFLPGFNIWLSSNVFLSFSVSFPQWSVFSLWLKEMHAGHSAKHLGALWHSPVTPGVCPFLCHWLWEWEPYCGPAEATHWILKHEMFAGPELNSPDLRLKSQPTMSRWPVPYEVALVRERGPPALPQPSLLILFHMEKVLQGLQIQLHPWSESTDQARTLASK